MPNAYIFQTHNDRPLIITTKLNNSKNTCSNFDTSKCSEKISAK